MQLSPKRLGVVLLCLGIVVLFVSHGDDPPEPTPTPVDEGMQGIPVLLPPTPRRELLKEALGVYIFENESENARLSLELKEGGKFRFITQLGKRETRYAVGTWSLVGSRLTLAYTSINHKPLEEGPDVAVNVYRGSSIVLKDTGLPNDVVLNKRTMIRQR